MASRATHIERAAALTQKLFFQFIEMNYDFRVRAVESRGNELVVKLANRPVGKYVTFEPKMMNEKEKEMVVSIWGCTIAAVCTENLLETFLQGTRHRRLIYT